MKSKNRYTFLFLIIILAALAGLFVEPKYLNKGIANLNTKIPWFEAPSFPERDFKLGLDLQGGIHLLYEADLSAVADVDKSASMQGLRDVIERRVNLFGVAEPVVQVQETGAHHRLIVELAGVVDPNQAIEMIGQTPYLEFKEPRTEEEAQKIIDKQKEVQGKTQEEAQKIEDWQLAFENPNFKSTILTGKYLERAELDFDPTTYQPLILIQFNDEGSKIFEELTEKNIGKPIAISIDDIIISAPVVQAVITGGRAQITGDFTVSSAKELARNLNAGALPVPIELISQQSVGPTLGKISLEKSLKAGIVGFLAVIIFMVIFYRLPGLLASISLVIYIALILALFKLIPITLTLAGIGGFILTIGMAIDANILIFSRMREEFKAGKSFLAAIEQAFRRAWPSIRDGNLTTLIIALVLFSFGTSFVKGFSVSLIIGIIISIFSAMMVTRVFLLSFEGTKLAEIKWLWK